MKSPRVLFITLCCFSAMGGIEKMCRIIGRSLQELQMERAMKFNVLSLYDSFHHANENKYFNANFFSGYGQNKKKFFGFCTKYGRDYDVLLLSHINLLPAAIFIKRFNPKCKIILLAHGIEVWNKLSFYKRKMLLKCDQIISVSAFTKNKMIEMHGIDEHKFSVINNCLDPFLSIPEKKEFAVQQLKEKYGISIAPKSIFTLTRMSKNDRYKGYGDILDALAKINDADLQYILAGSITNDEKIWIEEKIKSLGLEKQVILPGFVDDADLPYFFAATDVFVMPSSKEGFGLVFIEAIHYGTKVIAGNSDGSLDALQNGAYGELVTPGNIDEIATAIQKSLSDDEQDLSIRQQAIEQFSFENYKRKLEKVFNNDEL